ncbi:MAG: aryldialkylphosphatase [Dehalococcoidia bacterium]|nr:aryldialkylphosphatase [Dehalococcoidia bacterium]
MDARVITVNGPIDPAQMGVTLSHEHIMVDFVGADKVDKRRYRPDDVVATMLPFLREARALGVKTFVDCTPMYLGRDVQVLQRLSDLTGLNVLTNTGQYKEPYLPAETFTIEAKALADQWIREFEEGIDGTNIRPGFIKTAVSPTTLTTVQRKVTQAAAIASRRTGLTIATHTGSGAAATEVLAILERSGVNPSNWIFVHAQNERDASLLIQIASQGVWISLDGLGREGSADEQLVPLLQLLDAGLEDRILLSHDAGWYRVGEEPGGAKRPFTALLTEFIPAMRRSGITEEAIRAITVKNPSVAFAVS